MTRPSPRKTIDSEAVGGSFEPIVAVGGRVTFGVAVAPWTSPVGFEVGVAVASTSPVGVGVGVGATVAVRYGGKSRAEDQSCELH